MKKIFILALIALTVSTTSQAQSFIQAVRQQKRVTSKDVKNEVNNRNMQSQNELKLKREAADPFGEQNKALIENQLRQNASKQKKANVQKSDVTMKLDSIIYHESTRYTYTYDQDRLLVTGYKIDEWDSETNTFKPYSESTYEYDENNECVKLSYMYQIGTANQWGEMYVLDRQDERHGAKTDYDWDNENNEWYIVEKAIMEFDENDYVLLQERWIIDDNRNLYPWYRYEYEYFEGVTDSDGYAVVKSQTYSRGQSGDTDFTPIEKYEYTQNGLTTISQWVDSEWLITRTSYFKDEPSTLYTESYSIIDGQRKLWLKTKERRTGSSNFFDCSNICEFEYCYYNTSTGKISDGGREEHLYNYGSTVADTYYYWDTTTEQWVANSKTMVVNGQYYYYYPNNGSLVCDWTIPEGSIISYNTTCGDNTYTEQTYVNGSWVTTYYYGNNYIYEKNSDGYPEIIRTKHSLTYSVDATTGQYTYYSEYANTFDENYNVITRNYFSAPDTPSRCDEYYYNDEGSYSEIRYYSLENSIKALLYRDIYEYDPDLLYSQTLGQGGVSNYSYSYKFLSLVGFNTYTNEGHAFKAVKRYDANGNFMYDATRYYYSPLTDSDGIKNVDEETTQQDPAAKMYNLQGIPVVTPQPGQIVVTDQNRKFLMTK